MSQYYFLVASLPFLSFEDGSAVAPEQFLASVEDQVAARDLELLQRADSAAELPSGEGSVVDRFRRFDAGLRNELARLRASARGSDPASFVRRDPLGNDFSDEMDATAVARSAYAEESPLAGERLLEAAKWRCLDELETGHFFDSDRLVIYYLKLQVLARMSRFDRTAGQEAYTTGTQTIMNEYYQEQGEI